MIHFLPVWFMCVVVLGGGGSRPVPGQGWRACCPSSAPPPCGSLRVVRREGKRGRALPGTTAIPTLVV